MPIFFAVLMTRQAISPRLAMRSLVMVISGSSQRDVVVLLLGALDRLVAEGREGADDAAAGAVRHDHVVDETAFGGHERVGEARFIIGGALGDLVLVAQ